VRLIPRTDGSASLWIAGWIAGLVSTHRRLAHLRLKQILNPSGIGLALVSEALFLR
jgi:gamma-glutamyltranspeptidase